MEGELSIAGRLHDANFVDLNWEFFKRTARLFFSDTSSGDIAIAFDGVRFLGIRLALFGPEGWGLYAECHVGYAEILDDSDFLARFINGNLGFTCRDAGGMYDSAAKSKDEPGFRRPRHFALSCDAGMLDVLFEEHRIDRWEQSETG